MPSLGPTGLWFASHTGTVPPPPQCVGALRSKHCNAARAAQLGPYGLQLHIWTVPALLRAGQTSTVRRVPLAVKKHQAGWICVCLLPTLLELIEVTFCSFRLPLGAHQTLTDPQLQVGRCHRPLDQGGPPPSPATAVQGQSAWFAACLLPLGIEWPLAVFLNP